MGKRRQTSDNTPPKDQRLGAFTLVELLVVISIIALLVSILLPALSAAREAAKAVVCKTNLRQMGLGVNFYMEAHNDYFMPSLSFTPTKYWYHHLNDELREARTLFTCPARPHRDQFNWWSIGYGYNYIYLTKVYNSATGSMAADPDKYSSPVKLQKLSQPVETIIIADSNRHDNTNLPPGAYNPQYYIGWTPNPQLLDYLVDPETRHRDKANILWGDGHVGELFDIDFAEPRYFDQR